MKYLCASLSFLAVLVAIFTGTTPAHAATCTQAYSSSVAVPAGYGAAYDVFSSGTMLVQGDCGGATPLLKVGGTNASQYIYKIGYAYKGGSWQQINLQGSGALISSNWYAGSAQGTLPFTATDLANWNYIVGYVCTWSGSAWKCGCADTACSAGNWQLQAINAPQASGPGLGSGPNLGQGSQPAMADRFVDSIGSNAHFSFGDTAWGSQRDSLIIPGLEQIGIRHVRDMLTPDTSYEDVINRVRAETGTRIGFNLVLNYPKNIGCNLASIDVMGLIGPLPIANIDSFEGINEWDGFSKNAGLTCGGDWANDLRVSQQTLYQTVKGNSQLSSIPVLGPSLSYWGSFPDLNTRAQQVGNISQYMDYSAEHSYSGDLMPSANVTPYHQAMGPMIGSKPFQVTESGYHTDLGGSQGISELAQGKYMSRYYFENFNAGAARTYQYDLYNDGDGTCGSECQFGLMRNDGSLKPGAIAIKNEITILKDPGADFTTGSLNYTISGPSQVHHTLLQKRNGTMYLVLWQEVNSFSGGDANIGAVSVNINLGQTFSQVNQYDPVVSANPVVSNTSVSSLNVQVKDQALILELKP